MALVGFSSVALGSDDMSTFRSRATRGFLAIGYDVAWSKTWSDVSSMDILAS